MLGYKSIDEMTLEDCYAFLEQGKGHPDYMMVKARYEKMVGRIRRQEGSDFEACQSIKDYDCFIAKYKSMAPSYIAAHLDEASQKVDELIEAVKQQEAERRHKEQTDIKTRGKMLRRALMEVVGIIVLTVAIILLCLFHPVNYITVNDVEFENYGGRKTVNIDTNVDGDAVEIEYDNVIWLFVKHTRKTLVLEADPNPYNQERICRMIVKAYPTFNGDSRKSLSPKTMEVTIKQKASDNLWFTIKGVKFEMVAVEGGSFLMGSNKGGENEIPVHQVTLSNYYIGKTEVTQALWEAVTGKTQRQQGESSVGLGSEYPVCSVSYDDIVNEFLPKLEQLTGRSFRLLTEAEWEFAANGGNNSKKEWEIKSFLEGVKVWEWCSDEYSLYSALPQTNPRFDNGGAKKVLRGRNSTYRNWDSKSVKSKYYGFRLALSK